MPTAFDEVRYIRIGSSKEKLMKYPEYESRLFQILRNGYPTIANTESEYQDLTFNKMFLYFETKGVSLNRKTFKKNLGLLMESGIYNVLISMQSSGILCKCAFPGNRHTQEQSIQSWLIKTFSDIFSGRNNNKAFFAG